VAVGAHQDALLEFFLDQTIATPGVEHSEGLRGRIDVVEVQGLKTLVVTTPSAFTSQALDPSAFAVSLDVLALTPVVLALVYPAILNVLSRHVCTTGTTSSGVPEWS